MRGREGKNLRRAETGGYKSAWKSRYCRRGTVTETGRTASAPPPPRTTRRLISAFIKSSVEGGASAAETIGTGRGAAPAGRARVKGFGPSAPGGIAGAMQTQTKKKGGVSREGTTTTDLP